MLPIAILAGGLATRLRPITESIPKALVEIAGQPFVAHQLRLLKSRGAERVVFCVGYRGEMVREFVGDGRAFGIDVTYSFDGPELRGTAGAVRHALPLLGEKFFVLYGDSYLPCDYRAVEQAFGHCDKSALMTVYCNDGQWDTSNVEFADGRILAYDKKVRTPRMRYVDYGLGAFHREAFASESICDLAELYRDLLDRNELAGFEVGERFYEVGSFTGMAELSDMLKA